jgi:hypothetical protein
MLVPTRTESDTNDALADRAGFDLLTALPDAISWLAGLDGMLVLGNYLYADGGDHLRVSVAADVLAVRLLERRPDTTLAYLATPTDVFGVPADAVEAGQRSFASRTPLSRVLGAASGARLLQPAYPTDGAALCDALVAQQGPNYALAKRIQRWRAATSAADGARVSFHVAPASSTRSVTKNRALAAAFAGAHRFNIEVFDPKTANALMAALLVRDLNTPAPAHEHPWQAEAHAAVHGGMWRTAYTPRSALTLAALMGAPATFGGRR